MLESERLAYLNALGITQYVALNAIDGAPVLPELAADAIWPQPSADTPTAVDAVPEQVPVQTVEPALAATVSVPVAEPATAEPEPESPVTDGGAIPQLDVGKLKQEVIQPKTAVAKPAIKAQRFALAVVTVNDQYRLFVELAVADSPGLSALEHRMVSDLLALLGQPNGLDQFGAKLYRWPMVNNPRIASDPQAAREGLLGFIASAPTVKKNLFLGSKAAAVLSDQPLGQVFALGDSAVNAITTWSLLEMQNDWTRKADAWNSIRPFLADPA